MGIPNPKSHRPTNHFSETISRALREVQNGSITIIKQDNKILQVNISERLTWPKTQENSKPPTTHLVLLS